MGLNEGGDWDRVGDSDGDEDEVKVGVGMREVRVRVKLGLKSVEGVGKELRMTSGVWGRKGVRGMGGGEFR